MRCRRFSHLHSVARSRRTSGHKGQVYAGRVGVCCRAPCVTLSALECIRKMPLAIRAARVACTSTAAVSHRSFEFNRRQSTRYIPAPSPQVPTQFQSTFQSQAVPPRHVFKHLVCQALARSAPVDPNSKTPWLDQVSNAEENHRLGYESE